jgi:hypothetical protein
MRNCNKQWDLMVHFVVIDLNIGPLILFSVYILEDV